MVEGLYRDDQWSIKRCSDPGFEACGGAVICCDAVLGIDQISWDHSLFGTTSDFGFSIGRCRRSWVILGIEAVFFMNWC